MTEFQSKYLSPIVATLVGSLVSGILSGALTLFVINQSDQAAITRERNDFGTRLAVVESTIKDYSSIRVEMRDLGGKLERLSAQLEDLRDHRP